LPRFRFQRPLDGHDLHVSKSLGASYCREKAGHSFLSLNSSKFATNTRIGATSGIINHFHLSGRSFPGFCILPRLNLYFGNCFQRKSLRRSGTLQSAIYLASFNSHKYCPMTSWINPTVSCGQHLLSQDAIDD
jgi:hypothetical protein